jgi:hypothetical protein
MTRLIRFLACPAAGWNLLFLLIALAVFPTACGKKSSAPPAAQQPQSGAAEANLPLTGEVHPAMTGELRVFVQQTGRMPTNFTELARSRLDLVPRTPPGKKWEIDYATQEVKLVPR